MRVPVLVNDEEAFDLPDPRLRQLPVPKPSPYMTSPFFASHAARSRSHCERVTTAGQPRLRRRCGWRRTGAAGGRSRTGLPRAVGPWLRTSSLQGGVNSGAAS